MPPKEIILMLEEDQLHKLLKEQDKDPLSNMQQEEGKFKANHHKAGKKHRPHRYSPDRVCKQSNPYNVGRNHKYSNLLKEQRKLKGSNPYNVGRNHKLHPYNEVRKLHHSDLPSEGRKHRHLLHLVNATIRHKENRLTEVLIHNIKLLRGKTIHKHLHKGILPAAEEANNTKRGPILKQPPLLF